MEKEEEKEEKEQEKEESPCPDFLDLFPNRFFIKNAILQSKTVQKR